MGLLILTSHHQLKASEQYCAVISAEALYVRSQQQSSLLYRNTVLVLSIIVLRKSQTGEMKREEPESGSMFPETD